MLRSTFRHICSAARERRLWDSGISSWSEAERRLSGSALLPGLPDAGVFEASRKAFERRNAEWFAERLPQRERWRIAASFPGDVLFLDIETTGLSLHYDQLTLAGWSIGGAYSLFIEGGDPAPLLQALRRAKALATFNGSCFDLKFIYQRFPAMHLPQIHIDLRYLAKREGLAGGQKSIEREIGFARPPHLADMEGKGAVLLWHRFLRGDDSALPLLAEYNHADIEGMKAIFDECVARRCQRESIPAPVPQRKPFAGFRCGFPTQLRSIGSRAPAAPRARWRQRPTFHGLAEGSRISGIKIAGIDLVSSESRESGFCVLRGNKAETARIKSDAEMVSIILREGINLVSIDSPLGLPAGRRSCFEDDPGRDKYGRIRECERILWRRGAPCYPCLIPSMQKLTFRGMNLAARLRSRGVPVIESFPGGAQDALGIPRKQAGLEFLARGLSEFGLRGSFSDARTTHDELDAITCALVGLFFWAGRFEALGIEEEGKLIVPEPRVDGKIWNARRVAAFSGLSGSGKTSAANSLESKSFRIARSRDAVKQLYGLDSLSGRRELEEAGWNLRQSGRQRAIMLNTLESAKGHARIAIDSMRFLEDRATLIEAVGPALSHIHIQASDNSRGQRLLARDGERKSGHPVDSEAEALGEAANFRIWNNGGIPDLEEALARALEEPCL